MIDHSDLLRRISETLADLYDDQPNARRLARSAGLNLARLDISGAPVVVWANIVDEAQHKGKVTALLARAVDEYPANRNLADLSDEYRRWPEAHLFVPERRYAYIAFQEHVYLERILQRDEFELGSLYVDRRIEGKEIASKPLLPFEVALGRKLIPWTSAEDQVEVSAQPRVEMKISEALRKYPRLVIVGDPGTGKTTSLLWATWSYAQRSREGEYHYLPVYVALSVYRRGQHSLDNLISDALRVTDWRELPNRFHFMLDGFNEIPLDDRDEALREFQELFKNKSHRYVLTTRKAGYSYKLLEDLRSQEMELEQLSREETQEFVHRYLLYLNDADLEDKFIAEVDEAPGIRALSRIPLFLAMLLRVYDYTRVMPANRGLLYQRFVDLMYEWEGNRGKDVFGAIKTAVLSYLAFEMISEGHRVNAFRDEVQRAIEHRLDELKREGSADSGWTAGQVYAELVDNRLLCEQEEMVGFLHQTMQEYFAAIEMRERGFEQNASYFSDGRWHPSLVYISGLLDDSDSLIRSAMRYEEVNLATECFNAAQRTSELVEVELVDFWSNSIENYLNRWWETIAGGDSWGWGAEPEGERWRTNVSFRIPYIMGVRAFWSMRSDQAKRTLARIFIDGEVFPEESRCILCRLVMPYLCETQDDELVEMFRTPLLGSAEPCCLEIEPYYEMGMKRMQTTGKVWGVNP